MSKKQLIYVLVTLLSGLAIDSCSKEPLYNKTTATITQDEIVANNSVASEEDINASIVYNLFTSLVGISKDNRIIPAFAEKWNISADGKLYTFYLRDGLTLPDGLPISANDVVFSWQHLVNPKNNSPKRNLAMSIVNATDIIAGKKPATDLAVSASDDKTIKILLVQPNNEFLKQCAMSNKAQPSDPKLNSSQDNTGIEYLPVIHSSKLPKQNNAMILSSNNQHSQESPITLYNIPMEAIYYYDFNMTLPKYANNKDLRQALTMAINRSELVNQLTGKHQVPAYSIVTDTVESGQFANNQYKWAKLPYNEQKKQAQQLFVKSGYSAKHPLEVTISYNTLDTHKKTALAIAAMWQQVFGQDSIKIVTQNQEWQSFVEARKKANYDIARGSWATNYDSIDSCTDVFLCKSPINKSKYCNPAYDKLIYQARATHDVIKRIDLINQAIQIAQSDYVIIPLYQYTYYNLVNQYVKNYDIN
jgi:oligopeptide transport system substrate-binding protein